MRSGVPLHVDVVGTVPDCPKHVSRWNRIEGLYKKEKEECTKEKQPPERLGCVKT